MEKTHSKTKNRKKKRVILIYPTGYPGPMSKLSPGMQKLVWGIRFFDQAKLILVQLWTRPQERDVQKPQLRMFLTILSLMGNLILQLLIQLTCPPFPLFLWWNQRRRHIHQSWLLRFLGYGATKFTSRLHSLDKCQSDNPEQMAGRHTGPHGGAFGKPRYHIVAAVLSGWLKLLSKRGGNASVRYLRMCSGRIRNVLGLPSIARRSLKGRFDRPCKHLSGSRCRLRLLGYVEQPASLPAIPGLRLKREKL